uniref:Uncharacterized protein n=1 Tax=Zea mays TaxID=4577 RepID=A0A804QJV1_MAIZE
MIYRCAARSRGGAEGGGVVDHVPAGLDHRPPHAVADEHQVRLLAPDLHVLEVAARLDVDHEPRLAVVGGRRHRLPHRREVAAPVLGHHQVRPRDHLLLLQPPPVRPRHPRREPAPHAPVPLQLQCPSALAPPPALRETPQHRQGVGHEVGHVVHAALDVGTDAAVLRCRRPREAVQARVLVGQGGRQHGLDRRQGLGLHLRLRRGEVPRRQLRLRRAQLRQRVPQQLHAVGQRQAVAHPQRPRGPPEVRGAVGRRRAHRRRRARHHGRDHLAGRLPRQVRDAAQRRRAHVAVQRARAVPLHGGRVLGAGAGIGCGSTTGTAVVLEKNTLGCGRRGRGDDAGECPVGGDEAERQEDEGEEGGGEGEGKLGRRRHSLGLGRPSHFVCTVRSGR